MTECSLHPINNIVFLLMVTGITCAVREPVMLVISLAVSVVYARCYSAVNFGVRGILVMLAVSVLIVFINPLINHRGVTVLFRLPGGNAYTLEALAFGATTALILTAVVIWCFVWNRTMTSEKIVYLFGSLAPTLGLAVSMTIHFIPEFVLNMRRMRAVQAQLPGSSPVKSFSAMVTYAFEHGEKTASSMRSRGYGSGRRTNYSIFDFTRSDALLLILLLITGGYVIVMAVAGKTGFEYFPMIIALGTVPARITVYVSYAVMLMLPLAFRIILKK